MNCVIIDFEFTLIERTTLVLISGAIANSHNESKTIKLKGQPLLLRKHQKYQKSTEITKLPRDQINLIIKT